MQKTKLTQRFDMKDLGPLSYFLGIKVAHFPKHYFLSQSKYITDIIQRAQLIDCRTVDTHLEFNVRYAPTDGTPLPNPTLYQTLVGSLIYLTITRLGISYVVHNVSQFVASLTIVHQAIILRILHYLWGTLCQSIVFPLTSSLELCAYSNADQAGEPSNLESTTGFCIFQGGSLILWKSKK